jgi:hypothetical protein
MARLVHHSAFYWLHTLMSARGLSLPLLPPFHLMQAAYALPRWLKPDNSKNRVWLKAGQVQIIPPPSARNPQLPSFPTVAEALDILQAGAVAKCYPK